MTYKVSDFEGYGPVTGQSTYVILGEEATMNPDDTPPIYGEPDLIAQSGDYRVLADGTTEGYVILDTVTISGVSQGISKLMAALLADAVKRIVEDFEGRLEEIVTASYGRIETVEDSVSQDHVAMHELEIRLAAVERQMGVRVQGANITNGRVQDLVNRVSALEARQQDEEGEGADPSDDPNYVFDLEARSSERMRCFTNDGLQEHETKIRRDLAKEALELLRSWNCGNERIDAVFDLLIRESGEEARDEAGEGSVPARTPSDEGKVFPTAAIEANARRLAVREISLWLRSEGWNILADRMERAHGTEVPAPGQSGPFGDRSDLVS